MAALRPDKRQRPEINATQVVAEVTSAFLRYEQALTGNDVAELDRLFWANPHTVRYTVAENLHGYDAIRAFRAARPDARDCADRRSDRRAAHPRASRPLGTRASRAQVADQIEEMFEATGSRGGFMISVSQGSPRAIMLNIIDYLVPELQRRGRYRSAYTGRTLRENLAT